ncbi:MAG: transposase [Candidatus Bathyarchaeota archaeon]|nr:transposase [Candidatus Bathyarchaeota archaeon]
MLQTLMVKLDPSLEQHKMLLETMKRFNEACNHIAETVFALHSANKVEIHKTVYYPVREHFGLSSQLTVRAISKVCEAYKRDKSIKPEFRLDGAIVYDQRILSWKGLEKVSLITLEGRQTIPVRFGEYQKVRMDRIRGQGDLILVNVVFYRCVVVEASEESPYDPVGVLGVDLGIKNLAEDSDGEVHSGEQINQTRDRRDSLKAGLQSKGTKSAKRHLKKLSGRMARFSKDANHRISKKLVAKAKYTLRSIALEDLQGIRDSVTVIKAHRCNLHTWNLGLLRMFVDYKAKIAGVPLVFVYPRNTSRTCPSCGHIAKVNRPTRDEFRCEACGYAGAADHIAAMNIAFRAAVNLPIVAGKHLTSVASFGI